MERHYLVRQRGWRQDLDVGWSGKISLMNWPWSIEIAQFVLVVGDWIAEAVNVVELVGTAELFLKNARRKKKVKSYTESSLPEAYIINARVEFAWEL